MLLINNKVTSVLIPLDDLTRSTLSEIETFVKSNVDSPRYKPLWLKDAMYVNVSRWCLYEQINSDGSRALLPPGSFLGKGTYSLTLHVSHVYVGPHKKDETFSLSLHVSRIAYKAEQDTLIELIESIDRMTPPASHAMVAKQTTAKPLKETSVTQLTPVKPTKQKLKIKRGRPKKGLSEMTIESHKSELHHQQQ